MKPFVIIMAGLIGWQISATQIMAQQSAPAQPSPPANKDILPPPQEIPWVPRVAPIWIAPGPELGKRNIWEYYSVDSRGRFLPRVVMAPGGDYYSADGRPYPWTTFGYGSYMPHAAD